MERDLFLMLLALVISASAQVNLLLTVTVVDVTYRLICLIWYVYTRTCRSPKGKSPSCSAKRNGRLRNRS